MQPNLKHNQCIALASKNNTPICQNCLENQIKEWLKKRKPGLIPKLKKKAKIFFNRSNYTNHIICSICNKNINICDFCFRRYIKDWIKNKHPKLLAEFRLFFDSLVL